MPNSLIFCIPVKNCIINRTATLDRPQGLEPQNHFDPSLLCLPPKGRTSNFLASCSLILQCLKSLIATFSSVMLPLCLNECCRAVLRSPKLSTAPAAGPPPHAHRAGWHRGVCATALLSQPSHETQAATSVVIGCPPFPVRVLGRTAAVDPAETFSHPRGRAMGFTQWQLCSQEPSPSSSFACFLRTRRTSWTSSGNELQPFFSWPKN